MLAYFCLVHKDLETDYGVSFPDVPGCISAGTTLDDAVTMAREALGFHLEAIKTDGGDLPRPSPLEAVTAAGEARDAVAIVLIEAQTSMLEDAL
jgi:predicted RNase H-like HicB family nuclease